MKKFFRRMISTLLSAVIAFTSSGISSLASNVSAASWVSGSSAVINVEAYPFGYNFEGSGLRYPEGGLVGMWATCIPKLSVDGQIAYCIDSRATQGPNGQSNGTVNDSYADDHRISLALAYGYTGSTKYGYSADTERLATQIVIWNIMDGWYDNESEATAIYYFTAQMGDSTLIANIKTVYNKIKDNIKSYNTKPSFSGNSGTMEYNSSTKKWTYKFSDTRNVADQFDWEEAIKSKSYLSVDVKSGSVTFTSTQSFSSTTFTADYSNKYFTPVKGVPVTPNSGQTCEQKVVTYKTADPPTAKVTLKADEATGELEIKKVAQGGTKVDDILFWIFPAKEDKTPLNGSFTSYRTDKDGLITTDLDEGYYIVVEKNCPSGYFISSRPSWADDAWANAKFVTIKPGESQSVTFYNYAENALKIIKTSDDENVAGIKFKVEFDQSNGMAPDGAWAVYTDNKTHEDGIYTTNSDGEFIIHNLLSRKYRITEQVPDGYVDQDPKIVEVEYGKVTTVKFHNVPDTGWIEITKTSENKIVEGFEFKVYEGSSAIAENLIDTYTSDNKGKILIEDLKEGTYYIKEVDKEGYKPTEGKVVTVEKNKTTQVSFYNELETGEVEIIKTSENDVVEGFEFKLYKGASAVPSQLVGTYTTKADGRILIEDLKPGDYFVTETKKAGYEAQEGQKVTVVYDETAEVNFHNTLEKGDLVLYKTFSYNNGKTNLIVSDVIISQIVDDITFTLKGTSIAGETVDESAKLKKDDNGKYYVEFKDIPVGTFTLHEELGSTAKRYITPMTDKTVTISYKGESSENADNQIKTGNLSFIKAVEYGNVNDIRFNLSGTSDAGIPIDLTVSVTDKFSSAITPWTGTVGGVKVYGSATATVTNGKVVFSDIPTGSYTLTESQCNDYYVVMEAKTDVVIIADETVDYTGKINGSGTIINDLQRGGVKIIKTSENGVVEGILFRLTGISAAGMSIVLEAYTNADGIAMFEEVPVGTNYKLSEIEAPGYFIPKAVDFVDGVVVECKNTTEIEVHNFDKRGDLELTKSIENSKYGSNVLNGFQFRLYGTSDSGENVDITLTTNAQGKIIFKDILIGTYTLEEINVPDRYVVPAKQTVTIHWNGKDHNGKVVNTAQSNIPPAKAAFTNNLKYFSIEIIKVDSETGTAQGDSTLQGAVYGIYDDGVLVDTYVTDENGRFTTKQYECGSKWTVKEISSSEGYMLDTTVHKIGAEPSKYTLASNKAPSITSKEQIKKGNFLILKTTGIGTGIYELEVGAEFEVFLTKAGSYAAAKADERDLLVIGEDGTATTKDLPYGVYTVHQTKAWEGRALAADFNLYVGQTNNSHQTVPINNGVFESRLRVIKVDGDTVNGDDPKAIRYAGAAFHIYDPNGNLVTQTLSYPSFTVFDTFYTDENGEFVTPEPLAYGKGYSLVEVEAPYGYVLNPEPVYFDVVSSESSFENGIPIIEITYVDYPQKGKITVNKAGEIFSTVIRDGIFFQPQYSVEPLSGAVYAVYAAEDIYTADGTLRYAKGTEVDRITTNLRGTATTKELYLGTYSVVEIEAPYGMIVDSTPMTVIISYGDQTVEITDDTAVSFINERQQLALNMSKLLETDELFGIGMGNELLAVSFGLYAGEDLVANDGTVIRKDGLIEVQYCDENGDIVFESDLPFGKYYVQEISTEDHYILNGEKYEFTFEYRGQDISIVEISVNDGKPIKNELIYGIVGGIKVDAETGLGLRDAVIGLFPVGTAVFTAETAYKVTTTDEYGKFAFTDIPYGEYLVREIAAPHKYVLTDEIFEVAIQADGDEVNITIGNVPIYGNLTLTKVDVDYLNVRLDGAVFSIWADTNENGVLDDDDEYLGTMNAEGNGIYYYNHLKYGCYFVQETEAPKGYIRDDTIYVMFIEKDGETYTVSNSMSNTFTNKHRPEIGTTAEVGGGKYDAANSIITIQDTVSYKNLYVGKEYELVGILMNAATGMPLLINGEKVVSTIVFTPDTIDGEVVVTFAFDSSMLLGTTDIVVFEGLYEDGFEWAVHANLTDKGQTVRIYKPEIGTTATVNGEKEVNAVGNVTIVDKVHYTSLVVGETYILHGILMDADTNKPLLVNGNTVETTVEFTAQTAEGDVFAEFTFNAEIFDDVKTVVVFEDLYFGDLKLTTHSDINDEGQTVMIHRPDIKTTASDEEGEKEIFGLGEITIIDTVHYHDLTAGKEYTVTGVLMDKETGEEFLVDGEKIVSETTFTAESSEGDIDVVFSFDASEIVSNKSLVAFEELYEGEIQLAVHADIDDEDQTVNIYKPEIGTTAANEEGEKDIFGLGEVTVIDTVHYSDLIAGKEYTVTGVLMDKDTGEEFLVNGEKVVSETTFTAESSEGDVDVIFTFDASDIVSNKNLVVFEELYKDEFQLAVHADIDDEGQTITVHKPEISTTAANEAGEKDIFGLGEVTVIDTVHYHDLIAGKEYTVTGVLMDKETGEEFLVNGEKVVSETTFTAESSEGDVDVVFTFDASEIVSNKSLVAFEELYEKEIQLAVHIDIDDEGQTVTVHKPEIGTTAANEDGEKDIFALSEVTVIDTVHYHDLIAGKEYTVKGVLMDKDTGEEFLVDGEKIVSETTFTAESSEGDIDVVFTFNASGIVSNKSLVAFEELYEGEILLAVHTDIEDGNQTITVHQPEVSTKASTNFVTEGSKIFMVVDDILTFKNLIPNKEYVIRGELMDKITRQPFLVNDSPITIEKTFTAEEADGEIAVRFSMDADYITEQTEVVVFEAVYFGEEKIAAHADITDKDQTVTLIPLEEDVPKNVMTGFGIGGGIGGFIAAGLGTVFFKRRKKN